uniref:Adhesion G-protein coupled receptor G6 n=1 Tax=Seriola dumerili TaxID=41447 RepID=A0A3B4T9R2_SERDU
NAGQISTNCNLVLTEVQGRITSPCYPQKYPNSQACKWTMQAPTGFIIQLSFLEFDLEEAPGCIYDRVVVNTGNADVKFCGLTANGLTLNSTGNVMELSFTSDFSVQKKGFSVSFRHVAVALRNQKVKISGGNGHVTKVANSVSIPALTQLTLCFELERNGQKQKEWIFTYFDTNSNERLGLGCNRAGLMTMIVDGLICPINDIISTSDITSTMKRFCVLWTSSNGHVGVFFNGNYRFESCSSSIGRTVPGGGQFRLGGKSGFESNFDGNIYNLRLWDYAMTEQELKALNCNNEGNIIDWDNRHWTIPSTLAQTDTSLSCSEYSCAFSCLFQVCFNSSYSGLALLVYNYIASESLSEAAVSARLHSKAGPMGVGLQIAIMTVKLVENCPKEDLLSYQWPETRPTVTQYLPCFPYKEKSVSRTCLISPQNYSSYWSRPDNESCLSIDNIEVTAENAAAVAGQLASISDSKLSDENKQPPLPLPLELVNVAKINSSLAKVVVTIISNVMNSSETALATSSEKALKTVDELVHKIEFDGPSIKITSKNLALGILANNATMFNGASFSAFIPNNDTPQIDFESETLHPLAQVTLPSSLLSNVSLSETDRSSLSRINFMFFSSTNLFQQNNLSLNSYVVASSVGNFSISDLADPVKIEIAHLTAQPSKTPFCMFWDFSMKNGSGDWNGKGCRVSNESTSNKTICLCNHLTHFGILMDISGVSHHIDSKNNRILTFITYIGCGISAIFSAATLLTYIAFEKLRRDYPSKILMNLSASLLFLNMVFLLDGWLASLKTDWLCMSVAIFLHYFLLTSFTWMGLESIHMYIALVKVFNTYIRRYILKFCIVGWGLPAVLLGIVVAVDKNSYGSIEYGRGGSGEGSSVLCWIKNKAVFYSTCVGYFCLVFLLNVAMFIVVMMQICGRNGKRSNRTLREEVLRNLRSVISLTFLLGMTWGFALFASGPVALAFMYLFTIFNSLQGLFIFIFHCALKENVQKQWRRYLCCGRFRLSDNSDWSKTATNNTKKVSSDNLGKSLSSSSFGSSTANWTSKAKATLNPFTKRHSNTGETHTHTHTHTHTQNEMNFF